MIKNVFDPLSHLDDLYQLKVVCSCASRVYILHFTFFFEKRTRLITRIDIFMYIIFKFLTRLDKFLYIIFKVYIQACYKNLCLISRLCGRNKTLFYGYNLLFSIVFQLEKH